MTGLIPGVWSLLRAPATVVHDRVVAAERGFAELEEQAAQKMKESFAQRVAAIEEQLLALERGLEDDLKAAMKERLGAIEGRLASARVRLVDELRREWRRLMLKVALSAGAAVLAGLGSAFLLVSVWLTLRERLGATMASCALGTMLLLASVIPVIVLRSVLDRAAEPTQAK